MLCFIFDGKKICIPIYYLPVDWWRHGPDPGPIEIDGIKRKVVRELETLAVIGNLSVHLGKETAGLINTAVEAGFKHLKANLPKGVEVSFNPQPLPPRK